MQQKPFSMAPLYFYRSFFFISLTPKRGYATETELYSQKSRVPSQGVKSQEASGEKQETKEVVPDRTSAPADGDQEQPV